MMDKWVGEKCNTNIFTQQSSLEVLLAFLFLLYPQKILHCFSVSETVIITKNQNSDESRDQFILRAEISVKFTYSPLQIGTYFNCRNQSTLAYHQV